MTRGTIFAIYPGARLISNEFNGDMGVFDNNGMELLERITPEKLKGATQGELIRILEKFNEDAYQYDDFAVHETPCRYDKTSFVLDKNMCFSDWAYVINMMPTPLKVVDENKNVMILEYRGVGVFNRNKRFMKLYAGVEKEKEEIKEEVK